MKEKCPHCPCPGTCIAQVIGNSHLCEVANPDSPRYSQDYVRMLEKEHPLTMTVVDDAQQYPAEYVYKQTTPQRQKAVHVPGYNLPPPSGDEFSDQEKEDARAQGGIPLVRIPQR